MGARLDHLAQPDPLIVDRDVFQLVRDGAAVGVLQRGDRISQRLPRSGDPQHRRGYRRHHIRCEAERFGIQRRIAPWLAAQGIEMRREMSVSPVCLHQRHRRGDVVECDGRLPDRHRATTQFRGRRLRQSWLDARARQAQTREDLLVELLLALDQAIEGPQELA